MSDAKPAKMSKGEFICKLLHDSKKGTYCGSRNGDQWRKIIGFYLVFYGLLSCFWALNFGVMVSLIPGATEGPRIGNTSPEADVVGYAVIRTGWTRTWPAGPNFQLSDNATFESEVANVNELFDSQPDPAALKTTFLATCGDNYGYGTKSFCIFARMNRVFYQPDGQKGVTCTFETGSTPTVTDAVVSSTSGYAGFEQNTFLNQPSYEDPIIAIKVDTTPIAFADLDNVRLECKIQDVQEDFFFLRFTVAA